ncbi:GNAT family N-acetyltransferase [Marinobacter hydrocarbonoclasticus]|nr:GNAT family N-acetyltransferase [Marinobacter nauticus]
MSLRTLHADDRSLLYRLYGDAERMAAIGPAMAPPQIDRLMAERLKPWHPRADHWGCWVIEHDGEAMGIVGLRCLPMEQATAEVGFMLLRRGQGRGLASRGLNWLCEQADTQWDLDRLVALSLPDNRRSIGVLQRQGFHLGYRLPKVVPWESDFRDGVVYLRDRSAMGTGL